MLEGPDIFLLHERRKGSLKAITSIFRPKLSEEQKEEGSSRPQIVLYTRTYITFTPQKVLCICLREGATPAPPPPRIRPCVVSQSPILQTLSCYNCAQIIKTGHFSLIKVRIVLSLLIKINPKQDIHAQVFSLVQF